MILNSNLIGQLQAIFSDKVVILTLVVIVLAVTTLYLLHAQRKMHKHKLLLVGHLEDRAQRLIDNQHRLRAQHRLANEKSRQLQSSLEYARHIQTMIFPTEANLKEYFPKSFAFLESKDTVSGDFFWITEKYDTSYLAIADCTGHGVPGAFMSLIAHSMIKDIIESKGVLNTSNILNEIRVTLIKAFQRESPQFTCDGMDLTLCSFNRHNNVLSFSGANQSIYVTRMNSEPLENMTGRVYEPIEQHDDTCLYLLKGDRQPIGEHYGPANPFINHTAKLEKGDRFFAFTDGYRDQFGGSDNKRLKSRRFRNLILASQHLQLGEQRKQIVQSFNNWKGDNEQVDDVCVIGVEI